MISLASILSWLDQAVCLSLSPSPATVHRRRIGGDFRSSATFSGGRVGVGEGGERGIWLSGCIAPSSLDLDRVA